MPCPPSQMVNSEKDYLCAELQMCPRRLGTSESGMACLTQPATPLTHIFPPDPQLFAGNAISRSVQQRAPHTCAILPVPVKAALACWAGTLIAARGVDAAKAAASLVDAAFVHICGGSRETDWQWCGGVGARGWATSEDLKYCPAALSDAG